MPKFRIIGNMTGNSMDAVDLVFTEFDGDKVRDIYTFSKPYEKDMRDKIEHLRSLVYGKTRSEIEKLNEFKDVHNEYIRQIADCINEMCQIHDIDKKSVDAIGFHGKTLDHNPPSKAKIDGSLAYTVQMGSGKMLADLSGIKVVYDFRSDALMQGFEGAPLIPVHNAHIARSEGDGCYYNGGNTSNFAFIDNGKAVFASDAGPFNEYIDGYIRQHSDMAFDKDGQIGKKGRLNTRLLSELYRIGQDYYETALPKSGDPAYYHKTEIFEYMENSGIPFEDAVYTLEYFAAYTAVHALSLVPNDILMPNRFVLFGGGWKNTLIKHCFINLLNGNGKILTLHEHKFSRLRERFKQIPQVEYSSFGDYMEARLMADMAQYKLQEKVWELPEITKTGKQLVCGIIAKPEVSRSKYDDMLSRAAKGWQPEE